MRLTYCTKLFASLVLILLPQFTFSETPKVVMEESAKQKIKKIVLLRIIEPQKFQVIDSGANSLGVALGGIFGGIIADSAAHKKSAEFVQVLNDKKIRLGVSMSLVLQQALRSKGFDVEYLENISPKYKSDGKTIDYSDIQVESDTDAILNVWYANTGYFARGVGVDYKPWINMVAKLLDARTKETLYIQVFRVGFPSSDDKFFNIENDEKYKYASFDLLMSNFDEAVDGIVSGQQKISAAIAEQLK